MRILICLVLMVSLSFSKEIKNFDDAKEFINDGIEKGYFPKNIISFGVYPLIKEINLEYRPILNWDKNAQCDQHNDEVIIANSDENSYISCYGNDNIYILNDKNNTINDPAGDNIIFMGSGDDNVSVHESAIFVFQKNWGNDEINFSDRYWGVSTSKYDIKGYDGSFPYQHTNFIIFGDDIKQDDLVWIDSKTLMDKTTKSTITFNQDKKFTFLFKTDPIKFKDTEYFKANFKPSELNLNKLKIDAYLENDKFDYIINHDKSYKYSILKTKLLDDNKTLIFDEKYSQGEIRDFKIIDDFLITAQNLLNYSYIKTYDLDLKELQSFTLHGKIFKFKKYKDYLYILQNYTNYNHMDQNENQIFIYKIVGKNLTFVDKFDTSELVSFNILDDKIFGLKFLRGFEIYSLKNPQKPNKIYNNDDKELIWIEKFKDLYLFYFSNGTIKEFSFDNTDFQEKCSIALGNIDLFGLRKNSAFLMDNLYFMTAKDYGIYILDLEKCQILEHINTKTYLSNVMKINDKLLFNNTESNQYLLDLKKYFPNKKFKTLKYENLPKPKSKIDKKLSEDEIQSLLYKTAYSNSKKDAIKYCQMGGDPNFKGHEKSTPLEMAVTLASFESLNAMLECAKKVGDGAMIDAVFGTTHDDDNKFKLITLLEKYGGNFKATRDNCSMLHYAATNASLRTIKYIYERGADPKLRCRANSFKKPSEWAKENSDKEVFEFLKQIED